MVQAPEGRALDVETGDADVDRRLRRASSGRPWRCSGPESGEAELLLRFDGQVAAEKRLLFRGTESLVRVGVSVRRAGVELPKRILWGPGIGNPTPAEMEVQGYVPPAIVALVGGKVERLPTSGLGESRALRGVSWVGVESQYFAAILIPPGGPGDALARPVTLPSREDAKAVKGPLAALELGTTGEAALLYVGAKDHRELSRLGHELARVVPVGDWIGPLVVPLMRLLHWIHGHVDNYGWAIVVLTVLINRCPPPYCQRLLPGIKVNRTFAVPPLTSQGDERRSCVAATASHGHPDDRGVSICSPCSS
jgi:hypothetical protein